MMKELNRLITKDIFNCLSTGESRRLDVLRGELKIDDEAYVRLKDTITGGALHEKIVGIRRKPRRIMVLVRYAAILVLPLVLTVYFLSRYQEEKQALVMVTQGLAEQSLPVPARKQPRLVLANGQVVKLDRKKMNQTVGSNAVNTGNELVYAKGEVGEKVDVMEYNTIIVPKCGEYHVTLEDGTRVWFNEETELKFPVMFTGNTREVFLARGEAYFQVAHDERHPFIVHTVNGDVQVLGTEFNVKSLPNRSVATTLVKGSVEVHRYNARVTLKPNQQAVAGDVVNVISISDVNVEEFICWKDNLFYFNDVELESILDKLAAWYGFTVFYEDADARHEKYFVSIDKYAEVNKILEVIAEVSNVKFKINGRTVSVYK